MRRLLFACLLMSCAHAFAFDRLQVEGYTLPNGLQLLLKPGTERGHVAIRLVVGVGSTEVLAHSNKKIEKLEDFKGLKFRTAGAWAEVIQQVGASPTVVPPGEIYTLLQRKGVDAVEWATPGANLTEGFHEVAPYLLIPGVHQPSFVWEFFMTEENWNAIDEKTRAKLEEAAKLTTLQSYFHFLDSDMKAMETYRKAGIEIIELDKSITDDLAQRGNQLIADKLEARHPHIFGNAPPPGEARDARWEALKAAERDAKGATSALDGVAMALPALMRADKLQKRAARVGFDWPDTEGPAEKLVEEMRELAESDEAGRMEEAGDLLFAAVNLVRAHGIAPEDALRAANAKFERRFRAMERMADGNFADRSLEEQEKLWQAVKASERS